MKPIFSERGTLEHVSWFALEAMTKNATVSIWRSGDEWILFYYFARKEN